MQLISGIGIKPLVLHYSLPNASTSVSYCLRVIGIIEPWRTFSGSEYLSQFE